MPRLTRSFSRQESAKSAKRSSSPRVTLNQISYATSVMETVQNFLPVVRVWNSPKRVRCCESTDRERFTDQWADDKRGGRIVTACVHGNLKASYRGWGRKSETARASGVRS